jgi:hypothetical protein
MAYAGEKEFEFVSKGPSLLSSVELNYLRFVHRVGAIFIIGLKNYASTPFYLLCQLQC